jgi:hypothetical protein
MWATVDIGTQRRELEPLVFGGKAQKVAAANDAVATI